MSDRWSIALPDDFGDDYDWREAETRGVVLCAEFAHGDRRFPVIFFDPVRLSQSVESELTTYTLCYEPNVIVVPTLNRESAERAVAQHAQHGQLDWMLAAPDPEQ